MPLIMLFPWSAGATMQAKVVIGLCVTVGVNFGANLDTFALHLDHSDCTVATGQQLKTTLLLRRTIGTPAMKEAIIARHAVPLCENAVFNRCASGRSEDFQNF